MKIDHTEVKDRLMALHHEYHTLSDDETTRMEELDWIFVDAVQDEQYVYKGIDVMVDDVSLIDDEVVILALSGEELSDGQAFTSLNVEEFILNCI